MRIIGVLFTILGSAMAVRAQVEQPALLGLPVYGVTLSGSLENPVIENHSGRVVIGYSVKLADANGQGMLLAAQVMATSMLPAGIPDGGSVYVKGGLPINPTVPMPSPTQVRFNSQGPTVAAILRSVVFGDGQFVGVNELGAFEQFGKKLRAIIEVGIMAKTQAWDQVEALAQVFTQRPQAATPDGFEFPVPIGGQTAGPPPPSGEDLISYTSRQVAAMRLAQTRKYKGEAAADQLAEIYSSLPTLWK